MGKGGVEPAEAPFVMIVDAVSPAIMTYRDLLITAKFVDFIDGVNRGFADRDE